MLLSLSVPGIDDIYDAYVIAVDEEAKQRLERLTSLQKVKPVDIAKLQDVGNNNLAKLEHRPLSALHDGIRLSETVNHQWANPEVAENGDVPQDLGLANRTQETAIVHALDCPEYSVDRDYTESGNPCPTALSKCRDLSCSLDTISENAAENEEEEGEQRGYDTDLDSPLLETVAMETAAVVNGYTDHPQYKPPASTYMDVSMSGGGGGYRYPMITSSQENMYEPVESPEGSDISETQPQHREMAIDCPPNFIGVKKEPPRYPSRPNSTSFQSTPPMRHGRPPSSAAKTRTSTDVSTASGAVPRQTRQEEMEQLERIKRYQDDLRKRREEEERINREAEFLRTSLRGSKKLQALEEARKENRPPPTGIINPNYMVEEEDSVISDSASKSSTLPVRQAHGPRGHVEAYPQRPIGKPLG